MVARNWQFKFKKIRGKFRQGKGATIMVEEVKAEEVYLCIKFGRTK